LGQAGRAFIAREHDPDEHLRRLEDIFREVLA
jgi:hypothetical protein